MATAANTFSWKQSPGRSVLTAYTRLYSPEEVCKPIRASLDWVVSAQPGSAAQLPGPALSLPAPKNRALPVPQHRALRLPRHSLTCTGTEPQLLACRAQHCSECSGVLQQGFGVQEAQCSCPCRAEPCGALGLTMQFTPPLHSCLVFIMTFRLSYSTTNPCV